MEEARIYVMGDVHGQFNKLVEHLWAAGLLDEKLAWSGGESTLWFMGDFTDRGSGGIATVDLVMRMQREAEACGGRVKSLLGNHEITLLSVHRFDDRPTGYGPTFKDNWLRNGGKPEDLAALKPEHIEWMVNLPAMARVGDRLFVHADATFYMEYGRSVDAVNEAFRTLLASDDAHAWARSLEQFAQRLAFTDSRGRGAAGAREFLDIYGGDQIIHGHTPISSMTHRRSEDIVEPYVYADGLCVDVDGGMYQGGPGFIYALPALEVMPVQAELFTV